MANFSTMTTMSIRRIAARLLVMVVCVGCRPQPFTTPPLLSVGALTLSEPFDDGGTLPAIFTSVLSADTVGGVYRVTFTQPNTFTTLRTTQPETDNVIEVTSYLLDSSGTTYYGIGCRLDDAQHGYMFLVSDAGDFSIRRSAGNRLEPLVDWQAATDIVKAGANARNVLKAACVGDRLSFFVNNQFVAETHDRRYQDGTIGVVTGVGTSGALAITFDDLLVWDGS